MTALSHIRICDFSGQLAGAGATRTLAAFGAQVIRVEDPVRQGRWDILRGSPPFPGGEPGIERGGAFNNHNVEKLGVTLNLRTDKGKDLLRRLIAVSDVVTENFAAGVLDRLGFGYDALKALKPDVIYVSNSGFGHTGPYSSFKTWGPIVQAVCGLTFSSGLPDLPAAGWGYSYMDHHGGNFMAIATLAALIHRNRTGEGQWIDMSCTDAGATLCGPSMLDYTVNGRPLRRPGSPHSNHSQFPPMAPHNIYAAAGDDEWVAIACRSDDEWARWGLSTDARFETLAGRLAHEETLDAVVAEWCAAQDKFAVQEALQAMGIAAAAVQRPSERIDHDANTAAWGLWPVAAHPEMGDVRVDGVPIHLSATDWSITRGAPTLGQHNDAVFGDLLGVPHDELDQLRREGVL
jgi:benzylsuccinate CoA-transferase BbsF subunit